MVRIGDVFEVISEGRIVGYFQNVYKDDYMYLGYNIIRGFFCDSELDIIEVKGRLTNPDIWAHVIVKSGVKWGDFRKVCHVPIESNFGLPKFIWPMLWTREMEISDNWYVFDIACKAKEHIGVLSDSFKKYPLGVGFSITDIIYCFSEKAQRPLRRLPS